MVQGKPTKKPAAPKKPRPRAAARDNGDKAASLDNQLPISLQQSLLNIFKDACVSGSVSDLETTLQEVKGHLYNRDFSTAFGKDSYLQAYAARWSPSRALGYAQVFHDLQTFIASPQASEKEDSSPRAHANATASDAEQVASEVRQPDDMTAISHGVASMATSSVPSHESSQLDTANLQDQIEPSCDNSNKLKIACIGGGAGAEVIGLAGWLKSIKDNVSEVTEDSATTPPECVDVLCLDIAQWGSVIHELHSHCVTPRKLSKYASAAAVAANVALLRPESLNVHFQQSDVLNFTSSDANTLFSDLDLVTIMFTMNELYSTSVSKSQLLLHHLTASMKPGALLLVVDSPGSYSAVTINGAEKKYPMQWLLDHTLLEAPGKKGDPLPEKKWEKLVSDESRWFRLQEGLNYPIDLENMRYQIHLYRRCGPSP